MNNSAGHFGGMFKNGAVDAASSFLVDGCEFIDNSAGGFGGGAGIAFQSENAAFRNTLFKGNSSGTGNAFYAQTEFDHTLDFVNCTFVENGGGGPQIMHLQGGAPLIGTISNCVFGQNSSTTIHCSQATVLTTTNSVLADGAVLAVGMADGGGNVTTSPTFEDAASCDYRLAAGSSGIDMGDMAAYFAAGGGCDDLNGDPRFNNDPSTTDTGSLGSVLDAGCYEHQTALADAADCEGDANGDSVIDVNDISYVLFRLGNPCP